MQPLNVGLVGTGYAAKLRAETLQGDARSRLVAVAGHAPETTATFSQTYGAQAMEWPELVQQPEIHLVIVATVNRDHGAIARAALQAGKHVVLEYPLALDVAEAEALIQLASAQGNLLHVEHIELLSGIHQAIATALPAIGTPFYVRSTSLNSQHPAPQKWTYNHELFGFPLVGAVSRIHRLTNLFGSVATVSGQARFWGNSGSQYKSCICTAQLKFASGLVADVTYGKGEAIWQSDRRVAIQGEQGAILLEGEQGSLIQADQTTPLTVGSRRGLFAKDTTMVLDHLTGHTPLYVTLEDSLYALKVADAVRRSAETGKTIELSSTP
ncbi:Gfo/Idh/MocA family oxidoreductase [Oculatella sp. LEGE 06141]|uniref:Gfo/Idh/MocA family protein n=1 Tax=Oculatella sp. LEGE 06141 TaxID=1828648 RepID=UPI001882AECD|nr:Gfo/Idh/MocA family oxidoreductase [Oculatella sp. LEGE 06141]MBE9177947.1 Gfo/Idh/MocA family oxidoreductase [Oculatella sp. LEGE 06141]